MKNPLPRAAWLILLLALLLRVGYLVATPDQTLVHDAVRYDRIAKSVAQGHGYPYSRVEGRNTAFRPPAYPYLLAGAYELAGVGRRPDGRPGARRPPPRPRDRDADRRPDRDRGHAAVGSAGGARRDGARRGLHPADPRQQLIDVGAPVRVAAPGRARRGAPAPAVHASLALGAARRLPRRPHDPHAGERDGPAAAARSRGLDHPAAVLAARARRPGGARRARAGHRVAVDDPQRGRAWTASSR